MLIPGRHRLPPDFDKFFPTKEDYELFRTNFVSGLEKICSPDFSLMAFGSVIRPDFVPGVSDADYALIFPDDVITNKVTFRKISGLFRECLEKNYIEASISPMDIEILQEGRLLSFMSFSEEHLIHSSEILFGRDYRKMFHFCSIKHEFDIGVSHYLRRIRSYLIKSEFNKEYDPTAFISEFRASVKTLSGVLRYLTGLIETYDSGGNPVPSVEGGPLTGDRFPYDEKINRFMEGVDISIIQKTSRIFSSTDNLSEIYKNPDEMVNIEYASLELVEQIAKKYLDNFSVTPTIFHPNRY